MLFRSSVQGVHEFASVATLDSKSIAQAGVEKAFEGGIAEKAVAKSEVIAQAPPMETVHAVTGSASFWQNIALWFLFGAIFALVVYFIVEKIRRKD